MIGLSMYDDKHIRKRILEAGAADSFNRIGPSEGLICAVLEAQ
jgi:hypothetical protein